MKLTTTMLVGLTEQDVFDIASYHLLDQGERALNMAGGVCSYRAPDGRRCPVGWLIPDSEFRAGFEGKRAAVLPSAAREGGCSREFVAFLEEHERLLTSLQYIHDNNHPYMWWSLLRELASQRGLNPGVIAHMKQVHAERAEQAEAERVRAAMRGAGMCPMRGALVALTYGVPVDMNFGPLPTIEGKAFEHMSRPLDSPPKPSRAQAYATALALIAQSMCDSIGIPATLLTSEIQGHVITQPEETREACPT
jgi:hypothetical protein